MAILILPLRADGDPHYEFQTELERRTFGFVVRWNERAAAWFVSIKSADGVEVLSGIRLATGVPLLARFAIAARPAGELVLIDTEGKGEEPSQLELGTRFLLAYVEAGA